jgi:hypothetical protein
MHYVPSVIATLAMCLLSTPILAAECSAKSSAHTVPLLELYSSEGCSSCPPADAWLSNLTVNPTQFTPLAFHVDYWDAIGWKDPFAQAAFTERQRNTAHYANTSVIYTPQFVLNGKDFRSWNAQRLLQAAGQHQKIASPVSLSLRLNHIQNGDFSLKMHAESLSKLSNINVFVALYENKLTSHINAGENNGRTLKHDYVVRTLFGGYPLESQARPNQSAISKQFNLDPRWQNREGGAVVFAQNMRNGEILQSLALPFCR